MRITRDQFLIKASSADANRLQGTSLDLYVDSDFQKGHTHCTVVSGTIAHLPMSITKRKWMASQERFVGFYNDVELCEGDKVYFHHNVVTEGNRRDMEGEEMYLTGFSNIYAVVKNGKVVPLEDWCLAEAVLEDEEHYTKKIGDIVLMTKPAPERVKHVLKLKYVSKEASRQGLKEGDVIHHVIGMHKDADYDMLIEGKILYRISAMDMDLIEEKSIV